MDRGTSVYWMIVSALLAASLFFALGAEGRRRAVQRGEAEVANGELVTLGKVVDGDTVQVLKSDGSRVAVRLLGLKAFPANAEKDPSSEFGKKAVAKLEQLTKSKPIRVMLHTTPKDKHGRIIATLFVDDSDLGLTLIEAGLVLTYTVYPFPAMPSYLAAQRVAERSKRGLWGNDQVAEKARALAKEWRRRSE